MMLLAMITLGSASFVQSADERGRLDRLKRCVAAAVVVVDPVTARAEDWSRRQRTKEQANLAAKAQGIPEAQLEADIQKVVATMSTDGTAGFFWAACKATVK